MRRTIPIYRKRANPSEVTADLSKTSKTNLYRRWLRLRDDCEKGRWTHKLIPCIKECTKGMYENA